MKKLAKREILKKVTDDKGQEALRLMPNEMQVAIHELTDKVNEVIDSLESGYLDRSISDEEKVAVKEPSKKKGSKDYNAGYTAGLYAAGVAIDKLKEIK